MPKRIILHVGPHKTGSTALQQTFLALRDRLAACGILYPGAGQTYFGHHGIVDYCCERPSTFHPEDLRAEAAGANTLLLSSENFVVPGVPALRRLAALFPGAEIRIVYYLRRLVDLWPSHWQEMVKHGQSMPFPEYLAQAAMGWPETGYSALNQADQLGKLADVFGRSALDIVGYDRLVAEGRDIGRHFVGEVLGQPALAVDVMAPTVNVALKDWQLELVRHLNALRGEAGDQPADGRLREQLLVRLKRDPPDWLDAFKARVAASPAFEIDSAAPLVQIMQQQIVDRFGDRFTGGTEPTTRHYFAPVRKAVRNLTIPVLQSEGLRAQLVELFRTLVGENSG